MFNREMPKTLDLRMLGDNIRYVRERVYHMTQDEVAERLGTTRQVWARYESADREVPLSTLYRYSQFIDGCNFMPCFIGSRRLTALSDFVVRQAGVVFGTSDTMTDLMVMAWLGGQFSELLAEAAFPGGDAEHLAQILARAGLLRGNGR